MPSCSTGSTQTEALSILLSPRRAWSGGEPGPVGADGAGQAPDHHRDLVDKVMARRAT